jgi:hypothetical protein
MKFGFYVRPHLDPLPQERKSVLAGSGSAEARPANPVAQIFKRTAEFSPAYPSPTGWERVVEDQVRDQLKAGMREVVKSNHSAPDDWGIWRLPVAERRDDNSPAF